jgi:2-desacetyl-2-hydroxyethyl bacteriochlorophyllide A dehydrogenase
MQTKAITFVQPKQAQLLERELGEVSGELVLVENEYTVISGGTEKAYLLGSANTRSAFPRVIGYCGIGRVIQVGEQVKDFSAGDRVLVYHGRHAKYSLVDQSRLTKIEDATIPSLEAAFTIIASMGLGGVRKLELELGESAMVMGLGLLGIFAVQFLRLSGAYPLIAADLNPARRQLALQLGADYAFDPAAPDFIDQVKGVTKGAGVRATVEVTGVSAALQQALQCAARQGRISLLGCTRVSDCAVDFYSQVHQPGVKLIGAHNMVRPKVDSYPHHWTHHDDCRAILELIGAKRIQVAPIVSRVVSPEAAPEIYSQLCGDPEFPMGTVFDWSQV